MPPRRRSRHFDGWAEKSGRPVISFRNNRKHVVKDGVPFVYVMTGSRQFWSSNGTTIYTALMWSDGKPSCNCPGWATSKQYDAYGQPKDKSCAHSKLVREGDHITVTTLNDGTPGVIHHADDRRTHGLPTAPDWTLGGPVEAAPKKRKIIL